MKTIRQWLETISDETVREKALRNQKNNGIEVFEIDLAEAITGAFSWAESPEGGTFWSDYVKTLESNWTKLLQDYLATHKDYNTIDLAEYLQSKLGNPKLISL